MIIHTTLTILATFLFCQVHRINGQDLLATGSTLSLNGIPYYLPGKPFTSGHSSVYTTCASGSESFVFGLVPVTVIHLNSTIFSLSALETVVETFGQQDDVWGEAFLSGEDSRQSMLYWALPSSVTFMSRHTDMKC